LDKELNEAYKEGSSGIRGNEGLLLQVDLNRRACLSCALCLDQQYMIEMVEARKNGDKVERYDLFSGLLDAAQDELDNGAVLNDDELIGEH
jgi:hypothetical protein